MNGPLESGEVRHLAISLLTAPTARDAQTRIGASNLSNGCEFCLASNLMGDNRETPVTDRAWGGRVLGTAIHAVQEDRINRGLAELRATTHTKAGVPRKRPLAPGRLSPLGQIAALYPDAVAEKHMILGEIPGYGEVGTTADVILTEHGHGFDWKGDTDEKAVYLRDFLGQTNYGRDSKYVAVYELAEVASGANKGQMVYRKSKDGVSRAVWDKEMLKAEYKLTGYYTQCQLYMRAARAIYGPHITRWSLVFISRDNTMWFDNPAQDGYDDPAKMHGVWTLDFDFDEAHAEAAWQRGLDIWADLQGGRPLNTFEHHPLCFPCSLDARDAAKAENLDAPVILPASYEGAVAA